MFKFKELKSEWKKIVWPTRKELIQKTGIVIAVCAVFSAVISIYDLLFYRVRMLIQNLFV